jgi:hypothetical protein
MIQRKTDATTKYGVKLDNELDFQNWWKWRRTEAAPKNEGYIGKSWCGQSEGGVEGRSQAAANIRGFNLERWLSKYSAERWHQIGNDKVVHQYHWRMRGIYASGLLIDGWFILDFSRSFYLTDLISRRCFKG